MIAAPTPTRGRQCVSIASRYGMHCSGESCASLPGIGAVRGRDCLGIDPRQHGAWFGYKLIRCSRHFKAFPSRSSYARSWRLTSGSRSAAPNLRKTSPQLGCSRTGNTVRLDLLGGAWPGPRTLACLPGRVRANHFDVRAIAGRRRRPGWWSTMAAVRPRCDLCHS